MSKMARAKGTIFADEESLRIVKLRLLKDADPSITLQGMADTINKEFHEGKRVRKSNTISAHLSQLPKKLDVRGFERIHDALQARLRTADSVVHVPMERKVPEKRVLSFYETIDAYDTDRMRIALEARETQVYKLLRQEADSLVEYDAFSHYLSLQSSDLAKELLNLSPAQRERILNFLANPTSESKNPGLIHALSVRKINAPELALLLPLYQKDVEVSSQTLRSQIYDALVLTLKEKGYEALTKMGFRDLAGIRVSEVKPFSLEELAQEAASLIQPRITIEIREDKPLYTFCYTS